jgi:hypothetical protein
MAALNRLAYCFIKHLAAKNPSEKTCFLPQMTPQSALAAQLINQTHRGAKLNDRKPRP